MFAAAENGRWNLGRLMRLYARGPWDDARGGGGGDNVGTGTGGGAAGAKRHGVCDTFKGEVGERVSVRGERAVVGVDGGLPRVGIQMFADWLSSTVSHVVGLCRGGNARSLSRSGAEDMRLPKVAPEFVTQPSACVCTFAAGKVVAWCRRKWV